MKFANVWLSPEFTSFILSFIRSLCWTGGAMMHWIVGNESSREIRIINIFILLITTSHSKSYIMFDKQ